MVVDAARVANVLGGTRVLRHRVRTLVELSEAVERGLPVAALDSVVRRIAGDGPEAVPIRHRIVPKTTLSRRRERLSLEESERLERLARLVALAEQVWEEPEAAREFMTSAQPQLGGERPLDLVRTELGARRVEDLLLALEYSLPA